MVILPVLITLAASMGGEGRGRGGRWAVLRPALAGVAHGVGIHNKLYPLIYTVSYMAHFSLKERREAGWPEVMPPLPPATSDSTGGGLYPFPWSRPRRLLRLVSLWAQRLFLSPASIAFLLASALSFSILTSAAVLIYGRVALEEGVLYHLSRVDHRHNYSMFWYWIYLARGRAATAAYASGGSSAAVALLGKLALFLPQASLILYASLGVAPFDLPLALFCQTFLFVAHNRVVTAQYFVWYLCLLPLCSEGVRWGSRRTVRALVGLGGSVVLWLGMAYQLEMRGRAVHRWVWAASVAFFAANVNLMGAILISRVGSGRMGMGLGQRNSVAAGKKMK